MPPVAWLVRIIIYGLATHRVVNLFSHERGPFDVFDWIRYRAGIRMTAQGEKIANGFWAELLVCPLCLSVWFALPAALGVVASLLLADIAATWLAISCFTLLLEDRS